MSSPVQIIELALKLRTHLLVSCGSVVAAADYDAVSVFTVVDFELVLRGRIETDGDVVCLGLSAVSLNLFNLAVVDGSSCLNIFRIRLRSVDNAPMIVNEYGRFHLEHIPTCLLVSPELCLVCADEVFIIINRSLHRLNTSASTAAITTGYFAIATLEEVKLYQGKHMQWANSCSSVSSLLFASLSLVVGQRNGSISVYDLAGRLLSRTLVCDTIQRLIGPVKFCLHSPNTNDVLKSLPLELFNHETSPSDHVIIVQTTSGVTLWPYCIRNDGRIQCPTLRDLFNCQSSFAFSEAVDDLCLIPSENGFTLLIASKLLVIARRFSAANNTVRSDFDAGETHCDERADDFNEKLQKFEDREQDENSVSVPTIWKNIEMEFLPKEPRCEMTLNSPKGSTVSEELSELRREFRNATLELIDLRSSLSAFSAAMTRTMTEISEFFDDLDGVSLVRQARDART